MNDSSTTIDSIEVIAGLRAIPIPCAPGHDVVYGLANGAGDEIYLAPSNEFSPGLCAQVFAFDVVTEKFRLVIDLQRETGFDPATGLMPHSKIHLALKSTSDGRVFAATHFTAPGVGQKSFDPIAAYRGKYPGSFLLEYDPHRDRAINHGLLLKGEGARIACLDEQHHQFYFISYPRNHLFRYDYSQRTLHDLGRVGQENAFGLEADSRGNVYTSDDLGRLLRYSFATDRLEELNQFVPLTPGRRRAGNYIRRMTAGTDGYFFGFGNKGIRLFQFDSIRGQLEDLGVIYGAEGVVGYSRPVLPPAKALVQIDSRTLLIAFGGDGVYIDDHPVPNLVAFDLIERRVADYGKFATTDGAACAWIPQCAVSVPQHRAVFFGLQQTAAPLCLWKVDTTRLGAPHLLAPLESYQIHVTAVCAKPFGASVEGSDTLPFVRHGHVQMHELGWRGEDQVIPPGETSIADLCWHGATTLYGLTIGAKPHLFCFEPYRQNRFTENYEAHPWDLGEIAPVPARRGRLWADPARNRLLIALLLDDSCVVFSFSPGSERTRYRGMYHSVPHWPPVKWETLPFHREWEVSAPFFENLCFLASSNRWVSTTLAGDVTRLDTNGEWQSLPLDQPLNVKRLNTGTDHQLIAETREGNVVMIDVNSAGHGRIISAHPFTQPATEGIAFHQKNRTLAIGGVGTVHVLDPNDPGKPQLHSLRHCWKVRCLAWDEHGRIYGFYGEDDQIGEAFLIDPTAGVIEIGILQVSSQPRYWMCHRCDAIAVGARGEIYFGESDRLAHLFAFFPER